MNIANPSDTPSINPFNCSSFIKDTSKMSNLAAGTITNRIE